MGLTTPYLSIPSSPLVIADLNKYHTVHRSVTYITILNPTTRQVTINNIQIEQEPTPKTQPPPILRKQSSPHWLNLQIEDLKDIIQHQREHHVNKMDSQIEASLQRPGTKTIQHRHPAIPTRHRWCNTTN